VTLLVRALALLLLILVGGVDFQSWRSNGAARVFGPRMRVMSPRMLTIHEVWATRSRTASLENIGRGKGIVFSPDLSEPGNREFYSALGFAYFEDADWHVVLTQLQSYNRSHQKNPVKVLLVQSHGTNGDALKLQTGREADAPRSYISPAGLLEKLAGTGVRTCLLAACNAGRLFRPENYQNVSAGEGNRLFEPATLGVINASAGFDPERSGITIGRRRESHIEVINECHLVEFSPVTRSRLLETSLNGLKDTSSIAVPEMLIQLLLRDEQLHLVSEGFETTPSRAETSDDDRERLISRFLAFVDIAAEIAEKERQPVTGYVAGVH
jgi:hypothetical protein